MESTGCAMTLPILSYGHPLLKQPCREVEQDESGLDRLIDDMWQTLRTADGAGLAAPQVGRNLRLFIVDSKQTFEAMDEEERETYFSGDEGIRKTFINTKITNSSGERWSDREGCLSMPGFTVEVERPWSVTVEYLDRDFKPHIKEFGGTTARMIQHEFDHTEGVLFLEYLSSFKRALLKEKLGEIAAGDVSVSYPMKFPG